MRTVEFTKDFATKVKGDKMTCDNMLASQLVNNDKVAKYVPEEVPKTEKVSKPEVTKK